MGRQGRRCKAPLWLSSYCECLKGMRERGPAPALSARLPGCWLTLLTAPAPPATGAIASASNVVARRVVPTVAGLFTACSEQPLWTSFRDATTGETTSYTKKKGDVGLFHCRICRHTTLFTSLSFLPGQSGAVTSPVPSASPRRRYRSGTQRGWSNQPPLAFAPAAMGSTSPAAWGLHPRPHGTCGVGHRCTAQT